MIRYLVASLLVFGSCSLPSEAVSRIEIPRSSPRHVPQQLFKDILGSVLVDRKVVVEIPGDPLKARLLFLKIQEALKYYGVLTKFEVLEEKGKPSVGTYTYYRDIKSFR